MLIAATTQNESCYSSTMGSCNAAQWFRIGWLQQQHQKLGTTEQQHQKGGLLLPHRIGVATAAQKRRMRVFQHQLQQVDRAKVKVNDL
jgi:hypothetical protein